MLSYFTKLHYYDTAQSTWKISRINFKTTCDYSLKTAYRVVYLYYHFFEPQLLVITFKLQSGKGMEIIMIWSYFWGGSTRCARIPLQSGLKKKKKCSFLVRSAVPNGLKKMGCTNLSTCSFLAKITAQNTGKISRIHFKTTCDYSLKIAYPILYL